MSSHQSYVFVSLLKIVQKMGLLVSFLDNSKTPSLISMFTLHLSRFFDGPPGRNLQKLNAIIHREPYSTIAHGTYWSIVLLFGAPLVGISLLCISLYELSRYFFWNRRRIEPKSIEQELAVVITGCDSGFGKEMAFRLAAEGFIVFAGCLQEKSLKHFACESLIRPIVLDVTSDKDIEASFQAVQEWLTYSSASNRNSANVKRRHLHALVNNAGLGRIGYVDWLELSDYKICMEVNCFAQIRMVRAFLPVFKKQAIDRTYGDAQIVNMISMAGMLSGGGFAGTAYEVSKNAAEAFTDGLRLEMKMFGVKVVAVNPSFHETPLVASVPERLKAELWEPLSPDLKEEYGQEFFETYATHVEAQMNVTRWDCKVVVDSMVNAILSSQPPSQLLVGMDARYGIVVLRMMPQWVRHYIIQLNMPHQLPAMLAKEETSP